MANPNIRGLIGFNPSTGTARLLAAYEQDIVNVATGTGYGLNLDSTLNSEFEIFLDRVFHQNNSATPKTYNTTTNVFSQEHVRRTPRSKYQKVFKSRLFLGYCQLTNPQIPLDTSGNALNFPSRVFFSDLFSAGSRGVSGPELTWGIEWGRNGLVQAGTNNFYLQTSGTNYPLNQDFKAANIKVGDPLTVIGTDTVAAYGELIKTHIVTKVDSPYRLALATNFTSISSGALIDYWVGSNWFDVGADDGDVITGFGENANRLLISKLFSLWLYTGSTLTKVQGALGTSSNRSVINDRKGRTYYFHGSDPKLSGIYLFDGVSSTLISRAIDPFIQGMVATNYASVIAWEEGVELRWYLGNLSATNLIEAMTNAVATYNTLTGAWSVDPIADVITASSSWVVSSVKNSYLGTNDSQILKADSGNSFNSTAIRSRLETKAYYPASSEIICEFPYVQVIARNAKGVRLKYKLWDTPINVDDDYWALGEISGDKTEFTIPATHFTASGISFMLDELSTVENDWYIEKISLFYKPDRSRLI